MSSEKVTKSLVFILAIATLLLLFDYIFSIYNGFFYFELSKKNIIPAVVYAVLISLIRGKLQRNIAIIIVMFFTTIQVLYFQYFGEYTQPIAFIQFFNNIFEVTESFIPEMDKMIFPIIISAFFGFLIIKVSSKFDRKLLSFRFSSYLIVFGIFANLIMTFSYINNSNGKMYHWQAKALYPNKHDLSLFNFNKSLNYLLVGIIPQKIFGSKLDFPKINPPSNKKDSDKNIVLIIGESLRYDRLSLFGYGKPTTPLLDSLEKTDLIDNKIIYSGGTMTKTAVATILNRLKYPGMQQVVEKDNNLFYLAKNNGFKTHFISAQKEQHLDILESLLGIKMIDNFMSRSNFDKNTNNFSGYDKDLLIYLKNIDLKENNFIVLQQRGSHSPYKDYPKSYNKLNDNYDNTVLYTDGVLTEIFNYLKNNSPKETYFICVSDHGELLGNNGRFGHGWLEPEIYKIPMIVGKINSDENYDLSEIDSHYDLSNYIVSLLGYEIDKEDGEFKEIIVNGSDLDGLAGYMKFTFKNKVLIETNTYK
jgi:glucan phosphoethanolaminetransferase (alkaline phosphatase superfamily)